MRGGPEGDRAPRDAPRATAQAGSTFVVSFFPLAALSFPSCPFCSFSFLFSTFSFLAGKGLSVGGGASGHDRI